MLYTNRECLDGNSTKIWCHIRSAKLTSVFDLWEMQSGDLKSFSHTIPPAAPWYLTIIISKYNCHILSSRGYTDVLITSPWLIRLIEKGMSGLIGNFFKWTPAHP